MTDPRIYVACLASYNAGCLHGAWIDCEGKDADDIQTEVNAMLRASPWPNVTVSCLDCGKHADCADARASGIDMTERPGQRWQTNFWADGKGNCIKCETCNGSGEVPSAEEWAIHDHEGFGDLIGEYTSFTDVAKHAALIAEHGEAWIAYCDHVGEDYATESDFQDAYNGQWNSEKAFAENLVDDLGMLRGIPETLQYYFDYDAFARDLFINDYCYVDGYVFRR